MKRNVNYTIVNAMRKAGLSQSELARRSGLTVGYINQIVNGKYKPTVNVVNRVQPWLPGIDFLKMMSESGATIAFVERLNPAINMIGELMRKEGLNNRQFANKIKSAYSTLYHTLSGEVQLRKALAIKIEKAYPEFSAEKALQAQSSVFGVKCSTAQYQKKWKKLRLQS